jgi:hypothetical protein
MRGPFSFRFGKESGVMSASSPRRRSSGKTFGRSFFGNESGNMSGVGLRGCGAFGAMMILQVVMPCA